MSDQFVSIITVTATLGVVAELTGAISTTNYIRRVLYLSLFVSLLFVFVILLTLEPSIFISLIIFIGMFRAFNAARAVAARMNHKRLVAVTKRSSFYLLGMQFLTVVIFWVSNEFNVSSKDFLYGILGLSFISSIILLKSTTRTLLKTSQKASDNYAADIDLPTVSVCIPARNETEDLAQCLQSVIDSDYPKLEILVLDDCSHDKTSEIIKSFAKKGVRFIRGDEPSNGWLAKNFAYETLSKTASGDVLVFCGVDVRMGKKAIKTLIATMAARDKKMISVLPSGAIEEANSGIIQPMRYWWEVSLPRRMFNRPPVLSTLWAIDIKSLKKFGGFKAVDSMVIPEAYFARQLAVDDNYSFIRSSGNLSVKSVKGLDQQWSTAVRVRYPQLRHRPEAVALVSLAELLMLALPMWVFVGGFIFNFGLLWLISGVTSIMLGLTHYKIVGSYKKHASTLYLLLLPVSLVLDIIILIFSMIKYEFSNVIWKERNICIPVMQAIPTLPKY